MSPPMALILLGLVGWLLIAAYKLGRSVGRVQNTEEAFRAGWTASKAAHEAIAEAGEKRGFAIPADHAEAQRQAGRERRQ